MGSYKTPGIYVEEKQVLPPSVAQVSTAVPAFIGYVANDNVPINQPVRITTLTEYVEVFGSVSTEDQTFIVNLATDDQNKQFLESITLPDLETTMYYNLKLFFDNGGGSCYVVPVERREANSTQGKKESYTAALAALATESEPTLIVIVQNDLNAQDYQGVVNAVLMQCQTEQDRFGIFDLVGTGDTVEEQMANFRGGITTNKDQLKYGAAYHPALNTGLTHEVDMSKVKVLLGADSEGLVSYEQADIGTELNSQIIAQLQNFRLTLPASAAVAGAYAKTDNDRGVWKAPANVSLNSVNSPVLKVTNAQNGAMNIDPETGKSINVIRDFGTQGILIWGARTLAGNDNEWRYVPVRRLFNFIEESVKKSTSYAVFEPNDAMLWLKIKASVVGFLTELWRQGALAGGASSDAFFVDVGLGKTMTPQDVLEGRCIVKIGIAAVRPAEFIVLEFTHHLQQ